MIPLTLAQDIAGPITRTVKDAAYLLNISTELKDSEPAIDYTSSCASTKVDGLRRGVPRASFPTSDKVLLDAFESALHTLETACAVIVDGAHSKAQKGFSRLDKRENAE